MKANMYKISYRDIYCVCCKTMFAVDGIKEWRTREPVLLQTSPSFICPACGAKDCTGRVKEWLKLGLPPVEVVLGSDFIRYGWMDKGQRWDNVLCGGHTERSGKQ